MSSLLTTYVDHHRTLPFLIPKEGLASTAVGVLGPDDPQQRISLKQTNVHNDAVFVAKARPLAGNRSSLASAYQRQRASVAPVETATVERETLLLKADDLEVSEKSSSVAQVGHDNSISLEQRPLQTNTGQSTEMKGQEKDKDKDKDQDEDESASGEPNTGEPSTEGESASGEQNIGESSTEDVMNVAVVTPVVPKFLTNAQDAAYGWELWLKAIGKQVSISGGNKLQINSQTFPFVEENLTQVLDDVASADKFQLVIGTSTHYFPKILQYMQEKELPNLQCEGGNPGKWFGAKPSDRDKPFFGFGLHTSFTNYPKPFLKAAQAKQQALGGEQRVAFIEGGDSHFEGDLCIAAIAEAKELGMTVVDDATRHKPEDAAKLAKKADILFGCTLLEAGNKMMESLTTLKLEERPLTCLTIAPSHHSFREKFKGDEPLYISYPSQWHHETKYDCQGDDCPTVFKSTGEYVDFNLENPGPGGLSRPSYMRASCSAAGVALEMAAKKLYSDWPKMGLQDQRLELVNALKWVDTMSFFGKIKFDEALHMNQEHEAVLIQFQKAATNKSIAAAKGGRYQFPHRSASDSDVIEVAVHDSTFPLQSHAESAKAAVPQPEGNSPGDGEERPSSSSDSRSNGEYGPLHSTGANSGGKGTSNGYGAIWVFAFVVSLTTAF